MTDPVTPEGGIPSWAASVDAFASASSSSHQIPAGGLQLQFPDTSQLGGLCGELVGGSAFTSGLLTGGDPATQGPAGALVTGSQGFADSLCGLMGGAGSNTSPQSVVSGASDVNDAVNASPMAAGTITMGGSSGNTALDAINGMQSFADSLYSILQGCGCGSASDPQSASPQNVIDTAQSTADGVTASPMAAGIIAMGQDPSGSGNVALDAINGMQGFANALFSILSICGCGAPSDGLSLTDRSRRAAGGLLAAAMLDDNPYSPVNVDPQTIIDLAQATADSVSANPFAADLLGGGSGNLAIDALTSGQDLVDQVHTSVAGVLATGSSLQDVATAGAQTINQNTSNHVGHTSSTTAQSVNLVNQNLLIAQDFAHSYNVNPDPTGHWEWDGTDGDSDTNVLGCLKCTVDGSQPEYVSNEIPVFPGENIEVAATVKWESLAYTGDSPLMLGVEKYRQMKTPDGGTTFADIGWYTVATVATPGTDSSGYAGVNADGFVGIAGVYTGEPGVDQIRMRFQVADNADGGTVKFDNGDYLKLDLIPDGAVPGVGTTVDGIVTNLYGADGSGFTHNDAAVALANTRSAVTALAGEMASLQAEGHTGAIAGDDFSWTGALLGNANWDTVYSNISPFTGLPLGSYRSNGADAVFTASAGYTQQCMFIWQGTDLVSTTDYQLIQLVLDSSPQPGTSGDRSFISLRGRIDSGGTSWVDAAFDSAGAYFIGYWSGGTFHQLATGTCPVPGAGSTLSLYCGDLANTVPRRYTLQVGTTVIATYDDTGGSSPLGSGNRGWGWGAESDGSFGASSMPPNVNQWLGLDQ